IEHLVAILKSYRNDEVEEPHYNKILTQSEIDQLLGAMCETEMNTPELTKGEIADMSAKFKAEYGKPDGKDMREEHLFRQFVADETGWPYRGLNDDIAIAAIEGADDFNFDFDFDDGSAHMSDDEAEALAIAEEIRKEIEKRGKCGTEKPSTEHCECAVASLSITADKSGQGSGITVKIRRPKRDENTIVANTPTNHTFSVLIPEEAESGEIAENAEKIALRLKAISEKAAKEASKEAKIASVRDASVRALLETAGMSDCVEVKTWVGTPESCVTIKRGFGIKAAARIAPDDTSADIIAKVKDARARADSFYGKIRRLSDNMSSLVAELSCKYQFQTISIENGEIEIATMPKTENEDAHGQHEIWRTTTETTADEADDFPALAEKIRTKTEDMLNRFEKMNTISRSLAERTGLDCAAERTDALSDGTDTIFIITGGKTDAIIGCMSENLTDGEQAEPNALSAADEAFSEKIRALERAISAEKDAAGWNPKMCAIITEKEKCVFIELHGEKTVLKETIPLGGFSDTGAVVRSLREKWLRRTTPPAILPNP
ncbi:MAG: hypothetical protein IIU02_01205, partial [Treponema sp.]|uniref:hypothetical protein n=1 Tax=Treponema sp. TaxID=166 RepID=UPI00257A9570